MKIMKNSIYWIIAVFVLIGVLVFTGYEYIPEIISHTNKALLEGEINIVAVKPSGEDSYKIAAGSQVKFSAKIKNIGKLSSAPGQAVIYFAFLKPLDDHAKSLLFETEKVALPSLQANQEIEVIFKNTHQWPALADFIKNDWPMRQYQLVVLIDNQNATIGTKAISFSSYYYAGPAHEIPTAVPTQPKEHPQK